MKCPNCGADVPTGDLFCGECGTPVRPEEKPTPPSAAPPPAKEPRQGLPKGLLIGLGGLLGLIIIAVCVFGAVTLLGGKEPTPTATSVPTATPTPVPTATPTPMPTATPTPVPVSFLLAAPKLLPADTVFFALINPEMQGLAGFEHLTEVYGDISGIEGALDEFLDEMETELGISFRDDIKPWLGSEVVIASTDAEALIEGDEPVIVIAATTRDTQASDAFLEKLRERLEDQSYAVEEETYKDVTYYVQQVKNDWETPLVFGAGMEFVVLTTDKDAMEDIIDVGQGDAAALADSEHYTSLVDALPREAAAYIFFDMEDVVKAGLRDSGTELPEETSEQLEAFEALGMAVSLDQEGLLLDYVVGFDPDALSPEVLKNMVAKANPNRILKRIPNDVLGFISGQNLAAVWKSFLTTMEQNPDFEAQIEDLADALGLRIDKELLSWLTGEFAIALVKASGTEDVPVGGFAVFEVADQRRAEDTLEAIVAALKESAYLAFQGEYIGDVEMQVLMDPSSGEIIVGYGFTDEHLVIGFTEDALEDAVDDDMRSIADDETFKKVQKHLPSKPGGYFYVNVEAVWQLASRSMSEYEQQEYGPFLEPIEAIGIAASPTDPKKGIIQGTIFLYIPGG